MPLISRKGSCVAASLAAFALTGAGVKAEDRTAESKPATASPAAQVDFKRMPWHLVDLWWDLGKSEKFESYSLDMKISDPVPPDVSLYLSPIGLGKLDKQDFYGGLQTRSDGNTKADPTLRSIGPGLLMSMWGERDLSAIRPSDGGFLQSSGHEGDFVSVRRPYVWAKGTYTYRVVKMDREMIDGKPYTWVGAFVHSHEKDENVFVGALRFKGENLTLDRKIASFVEIYGQRRPVSDIPKLTVTFSNPRLNGEPLPDVKVEAVYPKGVPDYADARSPAAGKVEIKVGEPVEGRTARQVQLIKP